METINKVFGMVMKAFSAWEVPVKILLGIASISMLLMTPIASAGWQYGSFGYGWYGNTYNGNSGYNSFGGYANGNGYGMGGCTGSWGYNVCGNYFNGNNGYVGYGSYGNYYGNNGGFSFSFWGN